MIELVLTVVIVAILAYHAYTEKLHKEREDKLINAVMSKNAQELRDLEIAQNTEIKVEPPKAPDLEPLENLSDEDHLNAIMGKLNKPGLEEENG